ncbi:hypothetical protein [Bradyrhizobium sp. McL0615]|uniref:hypothetical protein n=1 Tax=Bradyrhizobium sp. McL0615 TaxID=3415673 RepID=UPI003CF8BE9F
MTRRLHRMGAFACILLPLLIQEAVGGAATSEDAIDETSLLYLSPDDWQRQPTTRKIALAADFMRIFCADQTMSPASLADCLDRDSANGALFERAIACASASAGR